MARDNTYMSIDKLVICKKCMEDFKDIPYSSPFQYRGLYINYKVPNNNLCNICKEKLYTTKITKDEIKILYAISHDIEFLKSMIYLKENDVIEYEVKLNQFKTQLQQQESIKAQNDTTPKCPHCKSTNIRPISGLNRGVSIAVWGIFSKKINKSFECLNCNYTW